VIVAALDIQVFFFCLGMVHGSRRWMTATSALEWKQTVTTGYEDGMGKCLKQRLTGLIPFRTFSGRNHCVSVCDRDVSSQFGAPVATSV
jgi:hypothetical protein